MSLRPRTVNQAPVSADERVDEAKLRGLALIKNRDSRWYLPDFADRRAERMSQVASHLWSENRPRRENYARYWSLYSSLPLAGVTPRKYTQRLASMSKNKLSLNAVASVVDSYVALVTDQRPTVSFTTSGADWEMQQRAQSLEKFNNGLLYENDAYEIGSQLEKDVGIFGTGCVMIEAVGTGDNQTIQYTRRMPFWLFCDDEEAEGGDPRSFFHRIYVDRLQAMAMWPEKADEIAEVQRTAEDYDEASSDSNSETDTVCITQGWHLPSGKGKWGWRGDDTGDGLYAVIVGDVLCEEKSFAGPFPFEFLYAQQPENGVWGRGFAEQLQGIQFEMNTIMGMVRAAMRCAGSVRWLVESTSMMNTQFISDVIGSMLKYTGPAAPQPIVPPAIAPEVYQHLDRLWQRAFEVPGISQLSAQSQKPAGLNSGKAIQTYADVESRRFQVAQHSYFNLFLRLARQTIHLARRLGDANPNFAVKCITKKTMTVVRWADAHMEEDDFAMKEYATSAFANTPEARMQQIQDLLNAGSPLISPAEGRRLLNEPDLEAFDSLEDASYNLTMDIVSDILAGKPASPPLPMMNLQESKKLAQFAYLRAYRMSAERDRLDALLQWVQQVEDMITAGMPPPAPPMPPGPLPPPGAPPMPPGMPQ